MSDRIHPTVKTMEAAGAQPFPHPGVGDAGSPQLLDRNRAVLTPRDLGYFGIRGAFWVHSTDKAPGAADSPPAVMPARWLKVLLARNPWARRSAILRLSLAPWARGFSL